MAGDFSLQQELIKGGITLLSVAIGGWLAVRNYRSNQWWDAKRKVYEEAILELERLVAASGNVPPGYMAATLRWAVEALEDDLEPIDKAERQFRETRAALISLTNRSSFLMSDSAINLLHELDAHTSTYGSSVGLCRDTLNLMIYHARLDLQTIGWSHRFHHVWPKIRKWFCILLIQPIFYTVLALLCFTQFLWLVFVYIWLGQERWELWKSNRHFIWEKKDFESEEVTETLSFPGREQMDALYEETLSTRRIWHRLAKTGSAFRW